jgi:hypothetical protein
MRRAWPRLAIPSLAAVLGCRGAESPDADRPAGPPWFEDVTEARGVHFVHDSGPVGRYFMPQVMGSGCALLDYDGDGRLDLYLIQNAGPESGATNRLYHQEPDGSFRDATAGSGLGVAGHGMGAAVGDVNNDGFPDLLLTQYGGCRLFLNNGDGTFADVTKESGLDSPGWAASATFFDFDRDGRLDLVVVNYVDYDPSVRCGSGGGRPDYCHPNTFPGAVARLFHNFGPAEGGRGVRFEDVTVKAGLARAASNGLGVLCADFDGDGWPDVFVANDSKANHLWMNQHDGTFREEAVVHGVAYNGQGQTAANMVVAWGDVGGTGRADLFVTHLTEEDPTLWRQGPRGAFRDRAHLDLGRALIRRGDLDAAEGELRETLRLNRESIDAHFLLGNVRALKKDDAGAEDSYRKVIELKPAHTLAHYNLGQCRLRRGDAAGAEEAFRAAARFRPDLTAAHVALAELLLKRGRRNEARGCLEDALRLAPGDEKARELLEQAKAAAPE